MKIAVATEAPDVDPAEQEPRIENRLECLLARGNCGGSHGVNVAKREKQERAVRWQLPDFTGRSLVGSVSG